MPRLFSAIELPESVRDQLSDLERPIPGAKWVDPDDLHITLRFAGDVEGRVAREFADFLGDIEPDAFQISLDGLGAFGGKEPRVIWAGVAASPPLEALARACERAARSAGLAAETRPYKPHVTLARLRGATPEDVAHYFGQIGAFRSNPITVSRFVLYSSKPKIGGGPYVVEAAYPMRGAYFDSVEDDLQDQWR